MNRCVYYLAVVKKLRIFFVLIFTSASAFSQTKRITDSLEKLVKESTSDTQKFNRLTDLINAYRLGNTVKAGEKCRELLALSQEMDQPLYSARAIFYLAVQKRKEGNYDTAITLYQQAIPVFEQYNDQANEAAADGSLGIMYWQQEDLVLATKYIRKALQASEKQGNTIKIITNLNNLAGVYQQQKKFDSSILYLKRMIKLSEETHDTTSMADAYGNIGAVYLDMGDTATSLPYCLLGARYSEITGYNYQLLTSCGNLGQIYYTQKNYPEAEKYYLKAMVLAEELQSPENRSVNYHMLAKLYEAMGDSGRANRFLERYNDLRDSLINESRMKQMTELEAKYQATKKDKDLLEERTASEKKTMLVYSLVVGLVLVIALAFFAWRGYRNKKRLSEEIHKQKEVIEFKSNEILDSIHYAERIQRAILPPPETFSSYFGDCFLLYIPKDIVSGDFYWVHREGKQVLLGVGDCTGHGVPGAFMSMLGIDKLNEIVKTTSAPGRILPLLNSSVKSTLHQVAVEHSDLPPVKETNVQDGMDIALISINTQTNTLTYSGANRPLWICRNRKEWIELKPTKVAIGGYTTDRQQFEEQIIALQKNDTIYLCTDGFADQFGGAEGKKIMTKRFREWLTEVQDLPMEQQQSTLHRKFEDWKGSAEQVDDVLLIGIRI